MPNNKHIIKKLSINLSLNKQSGAANIQQNISDFSKKRLFALLERIFDEFDTDEIIRIDKLKIDLGQLNKSQLEHNFIEKAEKELRSQLKEQIFFAKNKEQLDRKKPIDIKHISSNQSIHELLEHFLQTGNFPWWANQNNFRDFEEKILQYARGNSIAFNLLIRNNISNSSVRKRLSSQFSENLLTKLAPTFFPQSKKILQLKKDFSLFLHNIIDKRNNKQKFNTFWWDSIFEISLTQNLNTISYEKLLILLLRKITNTQTNNFIPLDELLEQTESQVKNLDESGRRKLSKDFIRSIKKVNKTIFKQRKKFNKIVGKSQSDIANDKKLKKKKRKVKADLQIEKSSFGNKIIDKKESVFETEKNIEKETKIKGILDEKNTILENQKDAQNEKNIDEKTAETQDIEDVKQSSFEKQKDAQNQKSSEQKTEENQDIENVKENVFEKQKNTQNEKNSNEKIIENQGIEEIKESSFEEQKNIQNEKNSEQKIIGTQDIVDVK
ncbi:MAG: contractile injection system tape measure protein, partial [Chitinophagales bacterium]